MNRQNKTKVMTFSAMMIALGVVCLMLASMMPGMRISLIAIAGVIAAMSIVQGGLQYGVMTVVATGLLAFLLVPAKEIVLLYAVFFGPYTLIKNLIERIHKLPIEWGLKLIFCAVIAVLLYQFADNILAMVPAMLAQSMWIFLPVIVIAFIAYDIVFSKLIVYVFERIHIR